jgi:hypothetical protein
MRRYKAEWEFAILDHMRDDLSKSNFDPELSDDDFRAALMSFGDNIRRHIRFLNGVVHQAAAGEVHRRLWELILDGRATGAFTPVIAISWSTPRRVLSSSEG